MNIAVTGGIGSGKSTASKILAVAMGAEHVDVDQLCRKQLQPGKQGLAALVKVFGSGYLLADGSLNRLLLRRTVFADSNVRKQLEMILHPLVRKEVADYYLWCCAADKSLVVEVPLLFEAGWQEDFTVSVVVYVPETVCYSRVATRDGLTFAEIEQVFAAQMSFSDKVKVADFVIDNSGTFVGTVQQLAWLGKTLERRENEWKSMKVRQKA